MAATNSAFVDEIVVNVEPDDHEDGVEDHLNCSAASSSTATANEPDLSGISGASQTPGQQQHRNSVLRCRSVWDISLIYRLTPGFM